MRTLESIRNRFDKMKKFQIILVVCFITCVAGSCINYPSEPCSPTVYTALNEYTRSAAYYDMLTSTQSDSSILEGWYRSTSPAGGDMPTYAPPNGYCQSMYPAWLQGSLPGVAEGIVQRTVCVHGFSSNCSQTINICVKNCVNYNVYYLYRPPSAYERYCFGKELPCQSGYGSSNGFTPGCQALAVTISDVDTSAMCFSTNDPCDSNNHTILDDPTRNVNHSFISQAEDTGLMERWYRAIEPAGIDMSTNKLNPLACQSFSPIWLKGTLPNVGDGIVLRPACVQQVLNSNECAEILQICVKNCGEFNTYFLLRPTGTHGRYCFASAVTTLLPDNSYQSTTAGTQSTPTTTQPTPTTHSIATTSQPSTHSTTSTTQPTTHSTTTSTQPTTPTTHSTTTTTQPTTHSTTTTTQPTTPTTHSTTTTTQPTTHSTTTTTQPSTHSTTTTTQPSTHSSTTRTKTTTPTSHSTTTTTQPTTHSTTNGISRPTSPTVNDNNTVMTETTDNTSMYLIIIGVLVAALVVGALIVGYRCYYKNNKKTSPLNYLESKMQNKPPFVSKGGNITVIPQGVVTNPYTGVYSVPDDNMSRPVSSHYYDIDDLKNGKAYREEDCKYYDGSEYYYSDTKTRHSNVYEKMAEKRDTHNYQQISTFKTESGNSFTADGDADYSEIPANAVTQ